MSTVTRPGSPPIPEIDRRRLVLEIGRMAMATKEEVLLEQAPFDEAKVEEFVEKTVVDLAATMTTVFTVLGDRLGLFRALLEPGTSLELAERTGLLERYVREWAYGLCTAGYIEHDPATGRFSLPIEHAAVLADDDSPASITGVHQMVAHMIQLIDPVERAFREGGGIPLSDYTDGFWGGVERATGVSFKNQLIQEWIPSVPGLQDKLAGGALVADIGCGSGVAAIELAKAYPSINVRGFDLHAPNIERATRSARVAGVEDRVSFDARDAIDGIPGDHDVVFFFDVLHDATDPKALLTAARAALRDDGLCVALDINCGDDVESNAGPIGSLAYGFSVFHCLTQSLAAGGAGLGTCGLPPSRMKELALDSGFSHVEPVFEGPLDLLYVMQP